MLGIFALFIVEIIAFRWGSAKLAAIGISHSTYFVHAFPTYSSFP
jgi:hypothetical protein